MQFFQRFIAAILILYLNSALVAQDEYEADIIVYGGSSAAVATAVQAVRSGRSVIMVSPMTHLGGLSSSGLGWTDTGNKEVIGGLAREFYQEIYNQYENPRNWRWQQRSEYGNKGQGTPAIDGDKRTMWIFEPSIAEKAFEHLISEHQVEVHRDEWLDRTNGVAMKGKKIQSITTLSGNTYRGKVFIDCTYEGDLMALAGVSYTVGRESNDTYGEDWNGIQTGVLHHDHYFKKPVSPYNTPGDPSSGLLPRISAEDPGVKGEGDHRLQAYCFRMCLTMHPVNRIPFTKPDGYDRRQYELLARVYEAGWDETFRKFDPIPNHKTDTNNHGPFSTDNIGMNYDYPEASYERRQEIIEEHLQYQKGLMYFLSHDEAVPDSVRTEMSRYGLAKDEFADNGHWPYKIYVREARRMLGTRVMTEHEIMGTKEVEDPIGMGSYTMDSHNVQRYVKPDGYVQNEGDIGVHPEDPYQISYGSITPKREECTNLLVPVCLSSSHIAFGSIRMEPVFMILGQSAALAADLAIGKKKPVQKIKYAQLKSSMEAVGQILSQPSN